MTSSLPTQMNAIEVASRWDAVFEGTARVALERALPAHISARRWYRTKTKGVQSARIVAAFPFPYATEMARIALVDLALDDGSRDTYVMPLAFVHGKDAARFESKEVDAIVVALRAGTRDGLVVDALALEELLAELLAAIARGETIEDAGATLRFHPLDGMSANAGRARVIAGEQTNTSVLFGERYVGKIVRKLDPGESADLEVGRFLTAVGYPHTPALAGWVDVRRGEAPASTVALLHAFVPNRGDAWKHVLELLSEWYAAVAGRDSAPPRPSEWSGGDMLSRASQPLPAEIAKVIGPYAALAELLGRRVGQLHVALVSRPADPAFAPEPLDRASREAIVAATRARLEGVLDMLGARGGELSDAARLSLAAVRGRIRSFVARLAEAAHLPDAGVKTRVHGDLHLGQVLFTGSDFVLIDFEGEPARPLEERKAKRSPLVDVAGMLRSFHYASVSALRASPEASRAALGPWASLWHRAVSAMFFRGWLAEVTGTAAVPRDPATTRSLLDLFLLEKGVYEIGYELDNRPDWVDIPLEGLREIIGAEAPVDVDLSLAPRITPTPVTMPSPEQPPAAAGVGSVAPSLLDPASPALLAFVQGKATHAHAFLGAHPHRDLATDFAVWAPHAASVSVIGDFNRWSPDDTKLVPMGDAGIFAGRVRGARVGQRYKYRIDPGSGGEPFDKTDPFGVMCEPAPGTASVIASLAYGWGDGAWMESRVQGARLDRPMSIYEVHLGSWRRNLEEGDRSLSYREIAAPLAAHARELGFTHVELMPLLEHPFYGSWGYGVTGFFAATSRYGAPADLMFLVDTLHQAGLGVIFDWVPAHFARDPHGLALFDGAPLFEPEDPARVIHPTWDTGLFDFSRPQVRSFLLSSAMFWIETFHADGLRIDGVESMLYRDHGRAPGTWTPNAQGGREDLEGASFLRELTSTLKSEHPEVLLAAEDSSAWPGVTRAASSGGLGFDLKWDMGFSHDMRRYLGIDPRQRSQHQGLLTFRSVYGASESFVLPLSHDDVVEDRGGALLAQMHGDPWQARANLRLLYATAWAQPGKKLLFMGCELGQPSPWHHDRSLDWHLVGQEAHDGFARMIGDLNRVYREVPALHAGDATANGFEWIDGSNAAQSVVVFARRGRGDDDLAIVALNLTPEPRHQYRIGVPKGGHWREIFNSDARDYGGSGHGNLGGVEAVPYPWNGRASSVVVTLPPLGAIFLARG